MNLVKPDPPSFLGIFFISQRSTFLSIPIHPFESIEKKSLPLFSLNFSTVPETTNDTSKISYMESVDAWTDLEQTWKKVKGKEYTTRKIKEDIENSPVSYVK